MGAFGGDSDDKNFRHTLSASLAVVIRAIAIAITEDVEIVGTKGWARVFLAPARLFGVVFSSGSWAVMPFARPPDFTGRVIGSEGCKPTSLKHPHNDKYKAHTAYSLPSNPKTKKRREMNKNYSIIQRKM